MLQMPERASQMIGFLITFLIICLVAGLVLYIVSLFLPQPWLNVARAVIGTVR
jgi:FtsH-binding integral membrane protein